MTRYIVTETIERRYEIDLPDDVLEGDDPLDVAEEAAMEGEHCNWATVKITEDDRQAEATRA